MSITLGNKKISRDGSDIYFIAEIGQNHQGCLQTAKKMIQEAKNSGADCVKFQKSCLSAKFTKSALERPYKSVHSWGSTYGSHKEFLEFNKEQYMELQRFSKEIGIDFTASAMDEVSLDLLAALNVPFIKIGSGDANNFCLLEKAAKLKIPLIISTGMQKMNTVERIVKIMEAAEKSDFALLHCVSAYPTEPKDCTLRMIEIFKQKFPNTVIGYSGHELGIQISIAAVLLGARIIERHFTLDKSLKGSDHACSLLPSDISMFTKSIESLKEVGSLSRDLSIDEINLLLHNDDGVRESLLPVNSKVILESEWSCKQKLGKSIVAARNLKTGKILEKSDLCIKVSEPNGIPAEEYNSVLGSALKSDIEKDFPIQLKDIQ